MSSSTWKVVQWTLSKPVLTRRLTWIVLDELAYGVEELPCTVVDLLDPERGAFAVGFLTAVGASLREADAVWEELSGGAPDHWQWMDDVNWDTVRQVLYLLSDESTEL